MKNNEDDMQELMAKFFQAVGVFATVWLLISGAHELLKWLRSTPVE